MGRREFTKEHRKNISIAMTGRKRSPEFGKMMSELHKGVPKTEEHKKNLTKALTKALGKKVINLDTGEVFDSVTLAAKSVNRDKTGISSVLKGREKTCGGYRWDYYKEDGAEEEDN